MEVKILTKENLENETIKSKIAALFRQLSPNKQQVDLNEVLDAANCIVLSTCFIDGEVVGIASMANYKVISGNKGWIEDVVVDENYRGKGIGRKLVEKLLNLAEEQKLSEVLLFTEPHREEAIKLYESLNFHKKESDIYILKR